MADPWEELLNSLSNGESGVSGGRASSASTEDLGRYSETDLRQKWRAGSLTLEQWKAELVRRGDSPTQADEAIAKAQTTGVTTKGALSAEEARAVEAFRKTAIAEEQTRRAGVAQTGDRDSFENPDRAAQGLSSVSEGGQARVPAGSAGPTSGGSGAKLPKTPEEELRDKQAAAREKAELQARMQRMAEDQYILESGGRVQRTADGRLESTTQDATGKWQAVIPHAYDPKTGLVTEQPAVGWRNATSQMSLDPRGAATGENMAQTAARMGLDPSQANEFLRQMSQGDRAAYLQGLGINATPFDLYSPQGGQFPSGSPQRRENLAAINATGMSLPGFGYAQQVNEFATGNKTPINTALDAQGRPVGVMTPEQVRQYRALGGFEGDSQGRTLPQMVGLTEDRAVGLGGIGSDRARAEAQNMLGEQETRQMFGADALPVATRQRFFADLNAGKIGDVNTWLSQATGRGRQRNDQDDISYQAIGGVNMAGVEPLPQMNGTATLQNTGNLDLNQQAVQAAYQQQQMLRDAEFHWDPVLQQNVRNFPLRPGLQANQATPLDMRSAEELGGANLYYDRQGRPRHRMYGNVFNMNDFQFANGGTFTADGPVGMVDMQTGQLKGVTGEAGPEAVVNVPLSRPAAPGLPSMVQGMMMGSSPMGGSTASPQPSIGPTPTEMIREMAKTMRPRVPLKVGG